MKLIQIEKFQGVKGSCFKGNIFFFLRVQRYPFVINTVDNMLDFSIFPRSNREPDIFEFIKFFINILYGRNVSVKLIYKNLDKMFVAVVG